MDQRQAAGKLFCFGLGYTALALAEALRARGWAVAGTCRDQDRRAALADRGIEARLFRRDRPVGDPAAAFAGTTHVLASIPPDADGDPALDIHGDDLARAGTIRWIGYLSTTGVYGDTGGAWVDEDAPVAPTTERSRRRVAAERSWLAFGARSGIAVQVFRLAGIYGPGRSTLDRVRAGTAQRIAKPDHVLSRIHVEDIVSVLQASMAEPRAGAVYNVCDDEPAPQSEVIAFACTLLGVEPPPEIPFEEAELSEMARSFYTDSRRVRNARIKTELGARLAYPSYREGLKAIATAGA